MQSLTPRERLERCYFHQETDRPGVYVRRGWPKEDPTYEPLIQLVDGKTDLKFGWTLRSPTNMRSESRTEPVSEDFSRQVTTLFTPQGELTATRLVSLKGKPGMQETYYIKDEADAEKYLSIPVPEVSGEVESFAKLVADVGDRGIVEAHPGMNPGGQVAMLLGSETFAIFSITHRELIHRLLERRTGIMVDQAKYMLARGVGPFFAMAGEEYIAPPLHGPKDFHDFNTVYDKRITDLVHDAGGRVHIHCHGSIRTLLDEFPELGADVLHPVEPPPLCDCPARAAKEAFRGKVCIEGNIQISDMYESTPDEIEAQTRTLFADAFDDRRGLIVCPSASPYIRGEGHTCFPNFERMVETVLAWRG